jgi:hypothetical protein
MIVKEGEMRSEIETLKNVVRMQERTIDRLRNDHKESLDALQGLADRIILLENAIVQTLEENSHLADGDNCTLKILKDALGSSIDESEE